MPPLILGLFLSAILVLLATALGHRLLLWLGVSFKTRAERAVFAAGVGFGALQAIPFALFACGAGHAAGMRAAAVALSLLLAYDIRHVLKVGAREVRRLCIHKEHRWIIALVICALIVTFLRAVCPPTDDDGLSYHVTAAIRLLHAGRFIYLPTLTYTNWPLCVESLFAFIMGLHPHAPVGIIQFICGAITISAVAVMVKRLANGTAAVITAGLMLAYPVFWEEMFQAEVDVAQALFATLAVYAVTIAYAHNTDRSAVKRFMRLSAICAGLAATAKMNGLWVIVAMCATLAVTAKQDESVASRLRAIMTYAGTALCVVAPWFIRTWIVTGNPVYPVFFRVFGGREWTSDGWPRLQHYFQLMNTLPKMAPTPHNLLLARIGLFTITGAIALYVYRRTENNRLVLPGRFAALFTMFVFTSSSYNLRFLLSAYPCVVLCAGVSLQNTRKIGTLSLIVGLLFLRIALKSPEPHLLTAAKVAVGAETTSDYYRRVLLDYPIVEYANANLPNNARILIGTWEEQTALYNATALRPNYWFQDSIHYDSRERLYSDLKRLGVTHLVLKPMDDEWCKHSLICDGRRTHETDALVSLAAERGTLLQSVKGVSLYRLNLNRP